jgi:hypothetical protein
MANFELSKLMGGKNPQSVMLEQTRGLKSKWEKTGLLEGLKERDQHSMAVLLENQAKQLLDEATGTGTTAGSEEWSGVALPLVRRIFGEIASKEFVSVQPMNLPSGLIFYLDFKYGTNQAGKPSYDGKSLFGGNGTSTFSQDYGRTLAATNGLYGEGRYGYSVNDLTSTVASASFVSAATYATASWGEVGFTAELSASIAAGQVKKITVTKASVSGTSDEDAVRSFVVSSSNFAVAEGFFPQFSAFDGTNYIFFVTSSVAVPTADLVVNYSVVPTAANRGDFEDRTPIAGTTPNAGLNEGTGLDIPEIDLELRSEAIVAKTRKLKAVWTP